MKRLASIPFLINRLASPRQFVSKSWTDRHQILQRKTNLFCWRRSPNDAITDYLEKQVNSRLKSIQVTVAKSDISAKLHEARKEWDPGYLSEADAFWDDVQMLVRDFMETAQAEMGAVHLKKVTDNQCTKFHVDGYSLRLFTTYLGRGTEWIPEKATNRKGLGKSNELIVSDASQLQRMSPFEVGILKGELTNRIHEVKGIVHRSPQIEDDDEKRIILRVDI